MSIVRPCLCEVLMLTMVLAQAPEPAPVVAGISSECLLTMCRGQGLAQWQGIGAVNVVHEGELRVGERAPMRYRLAINEQHDTLAEPLNLAVETSIHGKLERIGAIKPPDTYADRHRLQFLLGHALTSPDIEENRDPIPSGPTPLCTDWQDGSRFVLWPSSVDFTADPIGGVRVTLHGECIDIHVSKDNRRTPELVVNVGRQQFVGTMTIDVLDGKPTVRDFALSEPASLKPMWTTTMTSLVTGLGNVLQDLRLASGKLLVHSMGTRSWLCLAQDLEVTETQMSAIASGDVFVLTSPAYATRLLHRMVPGHDLGNLTLWLARGADVPIGTEHGLRRPDTPEDQAAVANSPGLQVKFAKGAPFPTVSLQGSILVAVRGKHIARVDDIDMPFVFQARGAGENRISFGDDPAKLNASAGFHCTPSVLAAAGNEIERYQLQDRMTRFVEAAYRALGLLALTNPIPFYENLPLRFGGRSYATKLTNGRVDIIDVGGSSCLRIHAEVAKEQSK